MKKLLYIYKSKYPWDIRVEKICNSLSEAGFDVTILARWVSEEKTEERIGNLKVNRYGRGKPAIFSAPFFINPFWKKFIKKEIAKIKPDIIIVREMHIAELTAKVAKKYCVPVVMDMAENYPAAMKDFKSYNDNYLKRFIVHKIKLPELIEKNSVRLVDGIITVCSEQNSRLVSQYAYDSACLAIVHNTPYISNEIIDDKIFEKKTITLGHHGNLTAEKSLSIFLEAFAQFSKNEHNIRLILAGGGDCIDDYRNILEKNNAKRFVEFTEEYDIKELPSILKKIDIGVIPYRISDFNNYTIHNKVFDYWMEGIPVVLCQSVPFMRIIEDTKAGMLLDFERIEPIINFLNNLKFYDWEYFSRNAVFFSRNKYNWENDSKVLIDFINNIIDKKVHNDNR